MTNYDRALAVLEAARRPGDLRIHPHDAVEALAKAGLLAPDLPEPKRGSDGAMLWSGGEVWIEDDDDDVYTDLPNSISWMRKSRAHAYALALLAASQYAKEEA